MAHKKHDAANGSRRHFIKNLALLAPTTAIAYRALANPGAGTGTGTGSATDTKTSQQAAGAPAGQGAFVSENDATAKALGYVPDGSKVDRPKKGDTEGKDQKCSNCQFFVAGNPIGGQAAGKCLMIPSGPVHAEGWCKSWMKKA
jgi:hypothetical protein